MADGLSAPARVRTRRSVFTAAIAIGILAIAVAAVFAATGIRLFAIQTPSMGQTAPVGSLVITQPSTSYAIGDIVTFTIDDLTVTHRIVGATGGAFTTRGDLNGSADGWSLTSTDIVGRAIGILPGGGFALNGAPWLLLGAIVTETITWLRRARPGWLWSVRLIGWSLTSAIVSLVLRPWFNVRLLDYRPADPEGAVLHIVNTGLLPLLAGATRLVSGQDASVLTTERLANGAFTLAPVADPSWPVRLGLIALCLLPFLGALLVRPADPAASPVGLRVRPDRRARRVIVPVSIVTVAAVVVLITVSTSTAAFSATIRNSSDAAGTNPFFTCRAAESYAVPSGAWGAWAVAGQTSLTEPVFAGSAPAGIFAKLPSWSNDIGCARDQPAASVLFDGSQCLMIPSPRTNPPVFSLEAWFSTTSTANGRIMGFSDGGLGADDGSWDRLVYLDSTGRVVFGVYPGRPVTVASPAGRNYADGRWHHVVASLSSAGMTLSVDGSRVDSNAGVTTAQNFTGTWKIGCGRLLYWRNGSGDGGTDYNGPDHFTGRIQYAAIYTRALTADEVRWHYAAGR